MLVSLSMQMLFSSSTRCRVQVLLCQLFQRESVPCELHQSSFYLLPDVCSYSQQVYNVTSLGPKLIIKAYGSNTGQRKSGVTDALVFPVEGKTTMFPISYLDTGYMCSSLWLTRVSNIGWMCISGTCFYLRLYKIWTWSL